MLVVRAVHEMLRARGADKAGREQHPHGSGEKASFHRIPFRSLSCSFTSYDAVHAMPSRWGAVPDRGVADYTTPRWPNKLVDEKIVCM